MAVLSSPSASTSARPGVTAASGALLRVAGSGEEGTAANCRLGPGLEKPRDESRMVVELRGVTFTGSAGVDLSCAATDTENGAARTRV
jgi:hypothetical protein